MKPASCRFAILAIATLWATGAAAHGPAPVGYPSRGRIGIEVQSMTAELREFFSAPAEYGLLIARVEEGRPAQKAGLRVGDVILAAGDEPLARPHDLVAVVARAAAATPLALKIVRNGKQHQIVVTPDGEPATAAALDEWRDGRHDDPQIEE